MDGRSFAMRGLFGAEPNLPLFPSGVPYNTGKFDA